MELFTFKPVLSKTKCARAPLCHNVAHTAPCRAVPRTALHTGRLDVCARTTPEASKPPEPHLPQTHVPRGASFSPHATRRPPPALCARAEQTAGPSAIPRTDRCRRRTTAASSPSSGRHARARALFKVVHSPHACAKPLPLLPLHRVRHCRPPVKSPLHDSTVFSDRPKLLFRFTRSLCHHPLLGIAPPSPELQPVTAATAGRRRAPSPVTPPPQPRPPPDPR
jgi:hypothetical protein